MSKTKKFKPNKFVDEFDDGDDFDSYDYEEYISRRKNKRIKQALKTKNIDALMEIEEDENF